MVVSNPKPLSIAVLTISDTRNEKTDSSGQFLAESLVTAGHHLHEKIIAQDDIPMGDITREDLMKSYSRFFELDRSDGWDLYSAKIQGWLLKLVLNVTVNTGYPLYFSGVDFDLKMGLFGTYKAKNIKIKGSKLRNFRWYKVAMPEES